MKIPKQLTTLIIGSLLNSCLLIACHPTQAKSPKATSQKQAIEEILQSAGLTVGSLDEALEKAELAKQSNNMDLAQLYYVEAYQFEPTNVMVLQKMTELYIQLQKYDLAEVCLKLILEQKPNDLPTLEQYGLLLLKKGNYPEAEKKLNEVIARKKNWSAYNSLGILANLQGDPQKAERYFQEADKIFPNSPEILNNWGFALYSLGHLQDAASRYQKALQINPNYKKALYNYGLLKTRVRKYSEAYTIFVKATTPIEASNDVGYLAMMNHDFESAKKYLEQAIRLSPQYYRKANDNLLRLQQMQKNESDKNSMDTQLQ